MKKMAGGLTVILALAIFLVWKLFISPTTELNAVDKNNNGIWDDVEPFIEQHGTSATKKAALIAYFKTTQRFLTNPEIGKQLRDRTRPDLREYEAQILACLWDLKESSTGFPDARELQDAIINTWGRSRAYIRLNANMSGGVYGLWSNDHKGNPCELPEAPN